MVAAVASCPSATAWQGEDKAIMKLHGVHAVVDLIHVSAGMAKA
jgi:hypothetical protein